MEQTIITLTSDIVNSSQIGEELASYCSLYSSLERTLFNELNHNKNRIFKHVQKHYIAKYKIHARIFKSLWPSVKGKIQQLESNHQNYINNTKTRIKNIENKIKEEKKHKLVRHTKLHKFNNKSNYLNQKLNNLEKENKVHSTWGSQDFYKKQWNAESKDAWLEDWKIKRNNHMFIIGSHDEPFGNSLCQLQNLNKLRLTLPKEYNSKHLVLDVDFNKKKNNNEFKNNYKYLIVAIQNSQPLSWKIFQNSENKKWYAQVSFSIYNGCKNHNNGTIGLDFNYNLVAICDVKKDGNKKAFKNFPYTLDKNNKNKNAQTLSDVANEIVKYAKDNKKTITTELLGLKDVLKDEKISMIAYNKFFSLLNSRAVKEGVLVLRVKPHFTSIVGEIKYKRPMGVSRHAAASYAIGRRGLNYIDRIPAQIACLLHSGERNKPNWTQWSLINKRLFKVPELIKESYLYFYKKDHTKDNFNKELLAFFDCAKLQ